MILEAVTASNFDEERCRISKMQKFSDNTNLGQESYRIATNPVSMNDVSLCIESSGYGVLLFNSSWFLVKCRNGYAISSMMDTAYRLSEQYLEISSFKLQNVCLLA
nr:hypothetical protein [Tanacetum cinerariifolium]